MNTRRRGGGNLAQDHELLGQYVEMAAESAECASYKDTSLTHEVIEAARNYDSAAFKALEEFIELHPTVDDATADDLWDNEHAAYLILMTLRREGVGFWDGDWDHHWRETSHYVSRGDAASRALAGAARNFWDVMRRHFNGRLDKQFFGLEQAFDNAAYETCPENAEDAEADDAHRNARMNPRPPPLPHRAQGRLRPAHGLTKVRGMLAAHDRERFAPERPPTWRGSSRDVVVNARGRRLRSTIDSAAVRAEVRELAADKLGGRHGYEEHDCFFEHGQWFVTAWDPREDRQVSFSVVDTSHGLDLEQL